MAATPTVVGDIVRHGAAYCTGEDYFCYISERRHIRHDGNDYNFEMGQPWSLGTSGVHTLYQEENDNFATANRVKNTNIKVEMGCQQPMACLRQMNMNFKIEMGNPYHVSPANVPLVTLPVVHGGLAREGSCRLGKDWQDYAYGSHSSDNYRNGNWQNINSDRRYGAPANHYHFGKGTESYCHFCCDPLIEFAATGGNTSPTSPYDYPGCNFNHVNSATDITASGNVDGTGTLTGNAFLERHHNWESPVWYHDEQYHGTFRNPHTQYPHWVEAGNTGGNHPNERR